MITLSEGRLFYYAKLTADIKEEISKAENPTSAEIKLQDTYRTMLIEMDMLEDK